MELITRLLQEQKIEVPNLTDEIKALGFNPDNISDKDAKTIVVKLKEKFAKTVKNGKLAAINTSGLNGIDASITESAKKMDAIEQRYDQLIEIATTKKAEKIAEKVKNMPNITMSKIRNLIDDSEGNLDFFLVEPDTFEENFLSKFGIE